MKMYKGGIAALNDEGCDWSSGKSLFSIIAF